MNKTKTKQLTQGAMIISGVGVCAIINVLTGTLFDMLFVYVATLIISLYTKQYHYKQSILVVLGSTVVSFMVGELFFTTFICLTLPLGIIQGVSVIQQWTKKKRKIVLFLSSILKNYCIFSLIAGLIGMSNTQEFLELQAMVPMVPLPVVIIGFYLLIGYVESDLIELYDRQITRIIEKRRKKTC